MYDDTMRVDKDFYNKLKEHYDRFQWISVKDRLPEPNTAVLVYHDGYYDDGYYGGDRIAIRAYKDEHFITGYNVTHWMPLPVPPKEDTE